MRNLAGAYILLGFSGTVAQGAALPEFPDETVPAFSENDYLFQSGAADYWTLSEYYWPQSTNCGCSATSVTMALNALRSRIAPDEPALNEEDVIAAIGSLRWAERTAEDGGGVTMADLERILWASLERFELDGSVQAIAPDPADATTLESLRDALAQNETSPDSIMLAYYNQAVVTGDPDGGLHVSPIGAFNAEDDRVLLMDVDRECHVPYWTSTETLLAALVTPDPKECGALANETGGCLLISASSA